MKVPDKKEPMMIKLSGEERRYLMSRIAGELSDTPASVPPYASSSMLRSLYKRLYSAQTNMNESGKKEDQMPPEGWEAWKESLKRIEAGEEAERERRRERRSTSSIRSTSFIQEAMLPGQLRQASQALLRLAGRLERGGWTPEAKDVRALEHHLRRVVSGTVRPQ